MYENGLKLPNLPEMIFADNLFELYVPANSNQPLIQFNAYDALLLVDPNTLPTFVVGSSETWQKARKSLPKIPFPFDWSYTSYYSGTLNERARVEITDETIDLEKLMRRDPIVFYDSVVLYGDDLGDNGDVEVKQV
jgi:type 2A phosphatase activator TIP41